MTREGENMRKKRRIFPPLVFIGSLVRGLGHPVLGCDIISLCLCTQMGVWIHRDHFQGGQMGPNSRRGGTTSTVYLVSTMGPLQVKQSERATSKGRGAGSGRQARESGKSSWVNTIGGGGLGRREAR